MGGVLISFEMSIYYFKSMDGKTYEVRYDESTTIKDITSQLLIKSGVDPERYDIIVIQHGKGYGMVYSAGVVYCDDAKFVHVWDLVEGAHFVKKEQPDGQVLTLDVSQAANGNK